MTLFTSLTFFYIFGQNLHQGFPAAHFGVESLALHRFSGLWHFVHILHICPLCTSFTPGYTLYTFVTILSKLWQIWIQFYHKNVRFCLCSNSEQNILINRRKPKRYLGLSPLISFRSPFQSEVTATPYLGRIPNTGNDLSSSITYCSSPWRYRSRIQPIVACQPARSMAWTPKP